MEDKCLTTCTHYVDKTKMRLYKKSFLWLIFVATIVVVALFVLLEWRYSRCLNQVVECHKEFSKEMLANFPPVELSRDSCYYLNEQLVNCVDQNMKDINMLLHLQSNKINSDFTILSVWAGILMIVFLIFSIYSMFKTDELVKQSREGLKTLETARQKAEDNVKIVEQKAEEEISNVTKAAAKELQKIKENVDQAKIDIQTEMAEQNSKVQQEYETRKEDFQSLYNEYVDKLKMSTETFKSAVGIIKNLWQDQEEKSADETQK